MKTIFFVSSSLIVSVTLMAVIRMRMVEVQKLQKRKKFDDIKLRVTDDILKDFQRQTQQESDSVNAQEAKLKEEKEDFSSLGLQLDKLLTVIDECDVIQRNLNDAVVTAQRTMNLMTNDFKREKAAWESQRFQLQKQFSEMSPLCNFLKPGSESLRDLCGDKVISRKVEEIEPQAEAPKQEEPQAEAPKQEEPQAEAPKQEEPQAEAPEAGEPNQVL